MSQKPIKVFRSGSLRASVFDNPNGSLSVSVLKTYKDKGGNWRISKSLYSSDCFVAMKLLDMAGTWMLEEDQKRKEYRDSQQAAGLIPKQNSSVAYYDGDEELDELDLDDDTPF